MRRIIVSTLFLSTVLLHGQTGTKGQSVTLEARNNATPSLDASSAASDVALSGRRVSTGVVFPKLVSEPSFSVSTADFPNHDLGSQQMEVSFRVDEKGVPQNVQLVKSVNQSVDERVLAAVRQYRFTPGTLDNQVVPIDVNMVVNFQEK